MKRGRDQCAMSEMIERVAAAIAKSCGCGSVCTFDPDKCCCRKEAAAAIKAMREPTMTMLNAAVDRTGAGRDMSWVNRSPQSLFETGHQAMIDAALRGD